MENATLLVGLRVVVIDPRLDDALALAQVLEAHGAWTATAATLDDALALIEASGPHVLVTDLYMNGPDFEGELRVRTPLALAMATSTATGAEFTVTVGSRRGAPTPPTRSGLLPLAAAIYAAVHLSGIRPGPR